MPTLWHANACARFVLCYSKHLARFQNECIATKTPLECFQHVLLNGLYWFLCDCHGYTIYILSVTCGILYSKGCFNSFSTADKTKRWKYHLEWKKKKLVYHLNLFEFKSFYGIDPVRRGLKSSWKFMGKIVDFKRKEREQNSHFTGLLDVWCSKKWARNLIESLDFCLHTVNPYQTILFAIWKSHFSTWKDTQFMAFSKHIRHEVVGDESML